MPNTKILVNFQTQKVVGTEFHAGSKEYQHLIKKGYVAVGVLKIEVDPKVKDWHTIKGSEIKDHARPKIFWDSDYFEPKDKYVREVETDPGTSKEL